MFNISSILFSLTVVAVVMAAILLGFWRSRLQAHGLKELALATTIGAVGALLAGIGAANLDFRLIFLGLVCVDGCVVLTTRAMRCLQRLPPRRILDATAMVVAIVANLHFVLLENRLSLAFSVNSTIFAVVAGLAARSLLTEPRPDLKGGCRFLGILFALFAVLHSIRAVVRPLFGEVPAMTEHAVMFDAAFTFLGMAMAIGWTLGFLWTSYSSAEYRLRAAYEELDRFTSAVAHDLKSPLNAVIGNIEAVTHLSSSLDAAQRGRFLASAHEAALGMNRFINELLADARANRAGSVDETVDPGECLKAARDNLRAQIEAVGADVEISPLPAVHANRLQITRVLQNLLDNAVKYRSLDRPLAIRVTGERRDGMVHIAVADNGLGIARADQDRVFQQFERAGKQTLVQGDGMGLAECRRIVEKFGGAISLTSKLGEGSTFTLSLPAAN